MDQIIPIQTPEDGIPTVNARDLHAFLNVGKDFSNWIKDRIEAFGFTDGEDFSPVLAKTSGGRPAKEYHITLSMAKELAMVERNDQGKKARRYFIECERQLNEAKQAFAIPQTKAEALRLAADLAEKVEEQSLQLAIAAPKVEFHDTVTASSTVCQMAVACHVAELPFGRNTLYQRLREMGVLISGGQRHNLPKQQYISQGLFTVKESVIPKPDSDEPVISFTTYATQKGIAWLIKTFTRKEGLLA